MTNKVFILLYQILRVIKFRYVFSNIMLRFISFSFYEIFNVAFDNYSFVNNALQLEKFNKFDVFFDVYEI